MIEFKAWPKTPRLFRDITITEKIDGTNACVVIQPEFFDEREDDRWTSVKAQDGRWLKVGAQSRKRLVTPEDDNAGFAAWVWRNAFALVNVLPEGYHYGEWWGKGIQRGYGLDHKRFDLFNAHRYGKLLDAESLFEPRCLLPELGTVPVLYQGANSTGAIQDRLASLREYGSKAAPGFMQPEGVVVYHSASKQTYKALLEGDDKPKGLTA